MSRLSDRLKSRLRMGAADTGQEAGQYLLLIGLMAITWHGGARGLAALLAQGSLLSGLAGALFAGSALLLVTYFLGRSASYVGSSLVGFLQALLVFICGGTGFIYYHSLLAGAGNPFLLAGGLAVAMAVAPPLLVLMQAKSLRERSRSSWMDEGPSLPLEEVLGQLGAGRMPSRAALHDALVWFEGAPHLIIPVTGPYERARARHVEDLISLAHILTDQGYAKPARSLKGARGVREVVRAFNGVSASWPFRQRYAFFRLDERVLTRLLEEGTAS